MIIGTVNMEEVVVMSCGAVGWMPPAETGGLIQHYVVRFFTGETMADTPVSEKELQRYMDNPERHFAKATNLPSNCSRAMYAQVYIYVITYIPCLLCKPLLHV